ncbi:efflux transporter periplasmic adaptor subunit [Sphaerothrix gracilis]|uniref:efflux RND transporter periplasmic adaptor subunit n=1 Tax=Sphaerothrix gracilis TaxID=3151835 RepID=UPI0031FBC5B2
MTPPDNSSPVPTPIRPFQPDASAPPVEARVTADGLETAPSPQPETAEVASEAEAAEKSASERKSGLQQYWWLIPVLGLVIAAGGVTFVRLRGDEPAAVTETTPLSVRAIAAQREPIRAWVSSEGNVRAVEYQHLTFETEGDVTYLADAAGRRLREGDRVRAGELLARIDDRALVADVRQAEAAVSEARQQQAAAAAEVARSQAQVAQARSQVQEAQAQLQTAQSARDLAATNVNRYRTLANQGAVSELEFDQRQNTLQDARSQVTSAQARVESARQQVASAQAQVRAAQQQLEARQSAITTAQARLSQAEVALEGASIYAPFDGIIAYLNISEGEYFTPQIVSSQLGGDYQGILERIPMVIIDPAQYEVLVDLAGPTGEQVEAGQSAFIASETSVSSADQGDTYRETLVANARAQGEVFSVNPAISPGGRAIEARVRLYPSTTETLRHGEQVLTWIAVAAETNAVVVPLNAVVRRDQVPYVFVVDPEQGTVEQRPVELGITGITEQAIASGVTAGELVVTEGQNRLVDGAAVQVVSEKGASS